MSEIDIKNALLDLPGFVHWKSGPPLLFPGETIFDYEDEKDVKGKGKRLECATICNGKLYWEPFQYSKALTYDTCQVWMKDESGRMVSVPINGQSRYVWKGPEVEDRSKDIRPANDAPKELKLDQTSILGEDTSSTFSGSFFFLFEEDYKTYTYRLCLHPKPEDSSKPYLLVYCKKFTSNDYKFLAVTGTTQLELTPISLQFVSVEIAKGDPDRGAAESICAYFYRTNCTKSGFQCRMTSTKYLVQMDFRNANMDVYIMNPKDQKVLTSDGNSGFTFEYITNNSKQVFHAQTPNNGFGVFTEGLWKMDSVDKLYNDDGYAAPTMYNDMSAYTIRLEYLGRGYYRPYIRTRGKEGETSLLAGYGLSGVMLVQGETHEHKHGTAMNNGSASTYRFKPEDGDTYIDRLWSLRFHGCWDGCGDLCNNCANNTILKWILEYWSTNQGAYKTWRWTWQQYGVRRFRLLPAPDSPHKENVVLGCVRLEYKETGDVLWKTDELNEKKEVIGGKLLRSGTPKGDFSMDAFNVRGDNTDGDDRIGRTLFIVQHSPLRIRSYVDNSTLKNNFTFADAKGGDDLYLRPLALRRMTLIQDLDTLRNSWGVARPGQWPPQTIKLAPCKHEIEAAQQSPPVTFCCTECKKDICGEWIPFPTTSVYNFYQSLRKGFPQILYSVGSKWNTCTININHDKLKVDEDKVLRDYRLVLNNLDSDVEKALRTRGEESRKSKLGSNSVWETAIKQHLELAKQEDDKEQEQLNADIKAIEEKIKTQLQSGNDDLAKSIQILQEQKADLTTKLNDAKKDLSDAATAAQNRVDAAFQYMSRFVTTDSTVATIEGIRKEVLGYSLGNSNSTGDIKIEDKGGAYNSLPTPEELFGNYQLNQERSFQGVDIISFQKQGGVTDMRIRVNGTTIRNLFTYQTLYSILPSPNVSLFSFMEASKLTKQTVPMDDSSTFDSHQLWTCLEKQYVDNSRAVFRLRHLFTGWFFQPLPFQTTEGTPPNVWLMEYVHPSRVAAAGDGTFLFRQLDNGIIGSAKYDFVLKFQTISGSLFPVLCKNGLDTLMAGITDTFSIQATAENALQLQNGYIAYCKTVIQERDILKRRLDEALGETTESKQAKQQLEDQIGSYQATIQELQSKINQTQMETTALQNESNQAKANWNAQILQSQNDLVQLQSKIAKKWSDLNAQQQQQIQQIQATNQAQYEKQLADFEDWNNHVQSQINNIKNKYQQINTDKYQNAESLRAYIIELIQRTHTMKWREDLATMFGVYTSAVQKSFAKFPSGQTQAEIEAQLLETVPAGVDKEKYRVLAQTFASRALVALDQIRLLNNALEANLLSYAKQLLTDITSQISEFEQRVASHYDTTKSDFLAKIQGCINASKNAENQLYVESSTLGDDEKKEIELYSSEMQRIVLTYQDLRTGYMSNMKSDLEARLLASTQELNELKDRLEQTQKLLDARTTTRIEQFQLFMKHQQEVQMSALQQQVQSLNHVLDAGNVNKQLTMQTLQNMSGMIQDYVQSAKQELNQSLQTMQQQSVQFYSEAFQSASAGTSDEALQQWKASQLQFQTQVNSTYDAMKQQIEQSVRAKVQQMWARAQQIAETQQKTLSDLADQNLQNAVETVQKMNAASQEFYANLQARIQSTTEQLMTAKGKAVQHSIDVQTKSIQNHKNALETLMSETMYRVELGYKTEEYATKLWNNTMVNRLDGSFTSWCTEVDEGLRAAQLGVLYHVIGSMVVGAILFLILDTLRKPKLAKSVQ